MLPMLVVGWRAFALSGEEAGRSAFVVDSLTVDSRVKTCNQLRNVLRFCGCWLRSCHSTTETLNLLV